MARDDRSLTPGRYAFVVTVDHPDPHPDHPDGALTARVQTRSRRAKWLALFTGAHGFTWGDRIYLRGALETVVREELGDNRGRRPLVQHELGHVAQWRRLGAWRFVWQYVVGLLRHGYGRQHPLEIEAIQYQLRADVRAQLAPQLTNALAQYRRARGLA